MQIRKMRTSDIHQIEKLLLDTVAWLNSIKKPLWKIEDVLWVNLSKQHALDEFYVVEEKQVIIATFLLCDEDLIYWRECGKGNTLFLHKLCVSREYAKQGVSQLIMDFFKSEAKRMGFKDCRLDCRSSKSELKRFYESHGFELVNEASYVEAYCTSRYVCKIE